MTSSLQTTIDSYDATAAAYAEKTFGIDTSLQRSTFLSYLPAQASILDVGCGPGRDAKLFTDAGHDVTGIDLSAELLGIASKHVPRAQFRYMDLRRIKFPDNHFHGVWAMSVLMHLEKEELRPAIAECARVLKPGGAFYFSLKRGSGEGLEADARFGGVEKYFAYYTDLDARLTLAGSGLTLLLDVASVTADSSYATKPWMDFYLRKN